MKVGNTSVSWDAAGKPVVTFPIPGVAGATGTATLDAKYMTEKVVVTQGGDDDRVHLQQLSGLEQPAAQDRGVLRRPVDRAQERRGGPRPDDERDGDGQCVCGRARAAERAEGDERHRRRLPPSSLRRQEPPTNTTAPTPRMGKVPDLTGNWTVAQNGWIGNYMGNGGRRCGPTQVQPCNRGTNQTEDFALYSPSRFGQFGRPLYKPEHWDKVIELDMWTNKYDPVMTCQPLGVPRQGAPRRIWQTENDITFLYQGRRCWRRIRRISHHPD